MKNLHVIILLFAIELLILIWGAIANSLAVLGAVYVDNSVLPGSQESLIIHIGAGIAYYGWVITLAIIFISLFSLCAVELYRTGFRIKVYKREDVD